MKIVSRSVCLTLWGPMDCSPPGPTVHGILQARILEWVALPFSRDSSWSRGQPRSPALQADSLPSESLWHTVPLPMQTLPKALLFQPSACRSQQPLSRYGRLVRVAERENPRFKPTWSLSSLKSIYAYTVSLVHNIHFAEWVDEVNIFKT